MKYNPITKKLFTNGGEFIKKLDCPFNTQWKSLKKGVCETCKTQVIDANNLSEIELLKLIEQNHKTCIKVYSNQLKIGIYETY